MGHLLLSGHGVSDSGQTECSLHIQSRWGLFGDQICKTFWLQIKESDMIEGQGAVFLMEPTVALPPVPWDQRI